MKRYCLKCGSYYSPNVLEGGRMPKGYKVCPQCKSSNTNEKTTPRFTGTRFVGPDEYLLKWNEQVLHNNAFLDSAPSVSLRGIDEPWYRFERSRVEALGWR